jgi:hypothetical protein
MLSIAEAIESDDAALVDLWTRCGLVRPWNDHAPTSPAHARAAARSFSSGATTAGSSRRRWSATTDIAAGSTISPSIRIDAVKAMDAP